MIRPWLWKADVKQLGTVSLTSERTNDRTRLHCQQTDLLKPCKHAPDSDTVKHRDHHRVVVSHCWLMGCIRWQGRNILSRCVMVVLQSGQTSSRGAHVIQQVTCPHGTNATSTSESAHNWHRIESRHCANDSRTAYIPEHTDSGYSTGCFIYTNRETTQSLCFNRYIARLFPKNL